MMDFDKIKRDLLYFDPFYDFSTHTISEYSRNALRKAMKELMLARKVIDATDKHFETGKQHLDKETWEEYHAARKELEG